MGRLVAYLPDGLIVESIADGPAARTGIRSGDIILAVNGDKVSNIAQFKTLIGKYGKRLAPLILRGNQNVCTDQ